MLCQYHIILPALDNIQKTCIALIFISRDCIYIANNLGFSLILIYIGGGGGNSMPPNLSVNI